MNSTPEISIIVPVYKTEVQLADCIDSLLIQSYTDFELLLIDDGSPDNAGSICDSYALRDKRIRVFHEKNSGVSVARNLGLDMAKGKYICFVDSDDKVKIDYVKDLYDFVYRDKGEGLVFHGCVRYVWNGVECPGIKLDNKIVFKPDFKEAFIENGIGELGYPWSKLFEMSLIRRINLRFNVQVHCCEDLLFLMEYVLSCDYISFGDKQNYIYHIFPSGTLSQQLYSFDSEYTCFMKYISLMRSAFEKYDFVLDNSSVSYNSVLMCFQRALKADYHKKGVKRKERVLHIQRIVNDNYEFIMQYYRPYYKIDIIGKYFLLRHWFRIYDMFISSLFLLRFRSIYLGPC